MILEFDDFLSAIAGIAALLVGNRLNRAVPFLRRICIPAPVTGGLVLSLLTFALHSLLDIEIALDVTLKDVSMILFFTVVGLQSDLKVIRKGGRPLVMMVLLVAVLITFQNGIGVIAARLLGVNPLVGMAAGSVTMCGGHGTAAGFTHLFESMGFESASTVLMAAATFGLLGGSLLGGPLAERLIRKKNLAMEGEGSGFYQDGVSSADLSAGNLAKAFCVIIACAGIGEIVSNLLEMTGLTFPTYFGALIVAVLVRNVSELIPSCPKIPMAESQAIGDLSLSLFLGMAMVSVKLWELSGIALPLFVILLLQVLLVMLFARFAAFPLFGGNYDAALLISGLCGFGLGATPNAMANMNAVCGKYRYSALPFLVVPMVGAMFVDLINVAVTSIFLNLI